MDRFFGCSARTCVAAGLVLVSLAAFRADAFEFFGDINESATIRAELGAVFVAQVPGGEIRWMTDPAHGSEPWFVGGTVGSTRLLRDINPGPADSGPRWFTALGNVVVFQATDGVSGIEMWRTDGTTAGTYRLADIGPGARHFGGGNETAVVGDAILFTADDGVLGNELWRTNGTRAGTYMVADFEPGYAGSNIANLTASSTHVFFSRAGDLWVSDGTAAGTHEMADLDGVSDLFPLGDVMFFRGRDAVYGAELWRAAADGSNPQMLANLRDEDPVGAVDDGSSDPQPLFEFDGSLIFIAQIPTGASSGAGSICKLFRAETTGTGATELASLPSCDPTSQLVLPAGALFRVGSALSSSVTELWITDGTAQGTGPLDVDGVNFSGSRDDVRTFAYGPDGEAYFFARLPGDGQHDRIWRSDGTRAGTREFLALDTDSQNRQIAYLDGRLYFDARVNGGAEGYELWSTDGTTGGTSLVRNIKVGAADSNLRQLRVVDDKLQFFAAETGQLQEPWVSDGTTAGTLNVGTKESLLDATADAFVEFAGELDGRVLFAADGGAEGRELFATDGTVAGTALVKDINIGGPSNPKDFMTLGDYVLFVARDWDNGRELWRSDGTSAGTLQLANAGPGGNDGNVVLSGPDSILDGVAYFTAGENLTYPELWRTDGTAQGTYRVPGDVGLRVFVLGSSGTHLLYLALDPDRMYLWSWDGSNAQIITAANGLNITQVVGTKFDGRLCFRAWDTNPQFQDVWCANGQAGDVVRATNFAASNLTAGEMRVLGSRLLVNVSDGGSTNAVYTTQGIPASVELMATHRIAHAEPFGANSIVYSRDNANLMVSDGTSIGTHNLLFGTTIDGELGGTFGVLGNYVVFVVENPENGPVLWRTDGTPAGTRFIADVDPGTEPALPEAGQFQALGSRLLFSAYGARVGRELWSLNATDPNASDDVAETTGGTPVATPVLDNDADFDGTLNAASVSIVTQPVNGTATVNMTSGAITYTANAGFSGTDRVTYRVADDQGNNSNNAVLSIAIAAGPGGNPPPVVNPPPASGGGGGGGGGGALGLEALWLGLVLAMNAAGRLRREHRYFLPNKASSAARDASASPVGATYAPGFGLK
jgi:ELWxxDGT repeat protein